MNKLDNNIVAIKTETASSYQRILQEYGMEPICMFKNAYGEYVYVIRPYKFDPEYGMVEDEQFIRQIHK